MTQPKTRVSKIVDQFGQPIEVLLEAPKEYLVEFYAYETVCIVEPSGLFTLWQSGETTNPFYA
jgi:hypothetical protein